MNYIINQLSQPILNNQINIKIKTDTNIQTIVIYYGDPYNYTQSKDLTYHWNQLESTMTLTNKTDSNHYFQATLFAPKSRCKYYFKLTTINNDILYYGQKGYFINNDNSDLYSFFYIPYIHQHEVLKPIDWVQNQIWCQIFVDRFNNTNPHSLVKNHLNNLSPYSYFGGTIKGITQQLDHLKDLGFTGLYLTPIFESKTNHKYNTIDYYQIDEHFGTKEDLIELIEQCHKRDMKILLDAVFNHSGDDFPFFLDVKEKLTNSDYYDWFYIEETDPLTYHTFANTSKMPKLKTSHPQVSQYFIDVLLYYLRDYKIDGWRFDVANELDHQFIREANQAIKSEFPDAYLLAEIWHDPTDWIQADQFDANMEYEIGTIFIDWLNKKIDTLNLIQRLCDIDQRTPIDRTPSQFHLIDSHDTARLMTLVNEDSKKAHLALTFLSLQKGSICIFYGTNYLLTGENDPYCRVPYPLNPTQTQLEYEASFKQILQFRKDNNSIFQSNSPLYKEKDTQLIIEYPSLTILFNRETLEVTLLNN